MELTVKCYFKFTVNPWLIHVNVWQKPLQYCKVVSLQLVKINGKKKIYEEKNRHHLSIPQWKLSISKNTCREENKDECFLLLVSLPLSEKNKNRKLPMVVSLSTVDPVCVPAHVYT